MSKGRPLLGTAAKLSEGGPDGEDAEQIQVIGLQLSDEHFVVDILNVREIVRFSELEITRVPHSHEYILGVTNLRGKVVPVVDLGICLGLAGERGGRTRTVVVEIGGQEIGFAVDAVSEVVLLSGEAIEPATSGEEYAVGITTVGERITTVLDLERTLVGDAAAGVHVGVGNE